MGARAGLPPGPHEGATTECPRKSHGKYRTRHPLQHHVFAGAGESRLASPLDGLEEGVAVLESASGLLVGDVANVELLAGGLLEVRSALDRVLADPLPVAVLSVGDVDRSDTALRAAQAGFVVLSPDLLRVANRLSGVTDRQEKVLRLIGGGRTCKQICREVGVSEATLKRELAALRERLAVSTTEQLRISLAGSPNGV